MITTLVLTLALTGPSEAVGNPAHENPASDGAAIPPPAFVPSSRIPASRPLMFVGSLGGVLAADVVSLSFVCFS